MACHDPNYALQLPSGVVRLVKRDPNALRRGALETGATALLLPCGSCLGCMQSRAREWAYRCSLELKDHDKACFITLTYDELHLPPTLSKRHLQLFWKRLRRGLAARSVRYFSCGEYGERLGRPHYHAIVFGLSVDDRSTLEQAWYDGRDRPIGFVDVRPVTARRIAYTAGYVAKKVGFKAQRTLRVDPETGEEYMYEPPFILMSRQPGIGKRRAELSPSSWRDSAVYDGSPIPVPRLFHSIWKDQATDAQKLKLAEDKTKLPTPDLSIEALSAAKLISNARQRLSASKRNQL